jgi:uncharacterized protein YggU (UPF0235/DUF167 family)
MVMDDRKYNLHDGKKGSAMAIRITPRASENKVVDILSDGTIKIHLTTGPSDVKTNEILLKFLAEKLKIAPARLDIVAGSTGRDKLVSVLDMDADVLHKKILELVF